MRRICRDRDRLCWDETWWLPHSLFQLWTPRWVQAPTSAPRYLDFSFQKATVNDGSSQNFTYQCIWAFELSHSCNSHQEFVANTSGLPTDWGQCSHLEAAFCCRGPSRLFSRRFHHRQVTLSGYFQLSPLVAVCSTKPQSHRDLTHAIDRWPRWRHSGERHLPLS